MILMATISLSRDLNCSTVFSFHNIKYDLDNISKSSRVPAIPAIIFLNNRKKTLVYHLIKRETPLEVLHMVQFQF